MVSNSTPDRTVALRRRPRCRHARQGSNSTRGQNRCVYTLPGGVTVPGQLLGR
jgi:hypothetical protein